MVGDLRLGLALVKAELQDLLLLALEALDSLLEQEPVLKAVYWGVIVGLEVHDRVPVRLVLAYGGVQACGVISPPQGQRLGDALDVGVEGPCQFLQRRRLSRPHGLVPDDLLRRLAEFLQAAGDAHRPSLVAEVALDLAQYVRRRVGRELDLPVHVEAVDRLYEADGGHLDQIVQRLPATGELSGEELRQGQLFLDHPFAGVLVAVLVVTDQQATRARLVRSSVASAHETSSTTVRHWVSPDPSAAGSSTSASTPSPAKEKRKRVGASPAWKPSSTSTASSNPPTPTLARAAIPASTRPTHDRSSSCGGSLR